jgi:hypothetical protein
LPEFVEANIPPSAYSSGAVKEFSNPVNVVYQIRVTDMMVRGKLNRVRQEEVIKLYFYFVNQ